MAYISVLLRQQVIDRAHENCEYCMAPLEIVISFEIDHITPQAVGGQTTAENLCISCRQCNRTKSDAQSAIDPESGQQVPLFNPRIQPWREHFMWNMENMQIIGITAVGRATVKRLRMNRTSTINARKFWIKAGWRPFD